jgi:hypothetical protein
LLLLLLLEVTKEFDHRFLAGAVLHLLLLLKAEQ